MKDIEVLHLKAPKGTTARLRRLAHVRSLKENKDITWAEVVRTFIEKALKHEEEGV